MFRLFLILFFLIWRVGVANALSAELYDSWKNELKYMENKAIPYVWGASDYTKADCSGFVYATAHKAGISVRRTTALEMYRGRDGWNAVDIPSTDLAKDLDIIWFTWPESKLRRPHGHVGLVYNSEDHNKFSVFHASSSAKHLIVQPYEGALKSCTSGLRRLTEGDKPRIKAKSNDENKIK